VDILFQSTMFFSCLKFSDEKSTSFSGADGGEGGNITLRMLDTDAGLLMMFVQSWTPTVSYSLDVSGGAGGKYNLFICFDPLIDVASRSPII